MAQLAASIEGIGSFVLQLGQCLVAPIGRPFKYLYNYKKNIDSLQGEVRKLKNTREEVQVKVTAAERNLEEINQNVKDWQKDVEKTITDAEKLIEEKENHPRCFNWITRYKHSKKAFKLKGEDISQLLDKNILPFLPQEDKVAHPTIPREIWLRSNEDYLAFQSRTSTEKNVWDALNDENIYMIGVYGMGGLGKTTLVQEVGKKAEKEKLFDDFVFVEVTETPDIKNIQTIIAKKLGLKFEDEKEDESERANKLYSRMKDKNILLIIDNIWEELDLKTVGIPSGADCGRSKMLMTTRKEDVLEKMGSTNNFRMNILNEVEAWRLFKIMAVNVIQRRELHSLPNDVCKECGGLPIVICTIAKALRNKRQESQWKDALRVLRMPSPAQFPRLLEKEYYKIKLSYDYLDHDELKKTFIISSLMENNTSISDLFKNIVSLGILEGANLTIEQARNRLNLVVNELKDSCLLLDGYTKDRFSMHDVVRIIAITCGYLDHHVFTERNDIESEWKNKDKLRKCTIISLVGNNIITQLSPEGLDCPELEFFDMNKRGSSFKIQEGFFKLMPKLRVLNLFQLHQSLLPLSIDLLTNLQTLCLDYGRIKDVTIIGKLKKLKILSLRDTDIEELPIEMGQLIGLKFLDLSNCRQLEVIAPDVISKLSQLEELYIKGCRVWWKVEVLKEFKHLSQLTNLEIDIKDKKMLPKDFLSKELKKYKISIGDWSSQYTKFDENEILRMLKFKFNSTISLEEIREIKNVELLCLTESSDDEEDLAGSNFNLQSNESTPLFNEKVIFSNLMALELKVTSSRKIWDSQPPTFMSSLTRLSLHGCGNIKYAFPFSVAKSLSTLQDLQISNCMILEEIVAEEEGAKAVVNFAFPQVTLLTLQDLPKLTAFYHGNDTWELPMLKRLVVRRCEKFTSKYLSFHENSLHISEPKSLWLENKINSDLEHLEIDNKLRRITWLSQSKTLRIFNDYELANILVGFLQRVENLQKLELVGYGYKGIFSYTKDEKQMQNTLGPSSTSFQYLKVLTLEYCSGLIKLITPSMARSLRQLREMSLEKCEVLIEIVENEGEGDATTTEIVFDNLKKLLLRDLKSFVCFCSGNYSFNFPSLEELIIGGCPNMKTFSQGILRTPKLQKVDYQEIKYTSLGKNSWSWEKIMEVENEGNDLNKTIQGAYKKQDIFLELKFLTFQDINSTEISYNQHPNSFYQNLTHLILSGCGNIKYVFPSFIAKSLNQLQHLTIYDCKVLEEIVAKEEGANEDDNFVFPHVTSLKLEYLPEFRGFYHTFEWPMLKELVVTNCDKFMTSKYLSFQENNEEGELHFSEPKSLCLNDKINSDLEELELQNRFRLTKWQRRSKTLEISYDYKFANISVGLLRRFENVEVLVLKRCEYKEIFSFRKDEKQMQITLGPSPTSFQYLKVLSLCSCDGLMKLITPSMAGSLVHLIEMSIESCGMLIEIVENEGDATTTTTEIVFDNLKKLSLLWLVNLTCFCSGNYYFNFPSLEEFIIRCCPNMKTFSKGILNTPKLQKVNYPIYGNNFDKAVLVEVENELNKTIQGEYKEQVDSNLKELTLRGRDIISLWEGEFPESFSKVKSLQLIKDEYANIPIQVLHKFNCLEKLILKASSYEEIFSFGEDKEHVGALTKLKSLVLERLFNLKCIWKQDSQLNSILQNLHWLEVEYCHNLTTLLPSLASFENLRALTVSYCNGMSNLMSSSTAKSLVQLKELEISECEMMTEVLANEGGTEKCEIVFEKLKILDLTNLESLTCFCSGDYNTLKFPFLETIYVNECSKMKTFFGGGLSMPRLHELNMSDCSKSDIDTIIQQLQNDCSKLWERFRG